MKTRAEMDAQVVTAIRDVGYGVIPKALEPDLVSDLSHTLESVQDGEGVRSRGDVYAVRNLLQLAPGIKRALEAPVVTGVVDAILGAGAVLVRGVGYRRVPRPSWKVSWHQEAIVAVRERQEAIGFGPWMWKAGVQHVQAPPGVMAGMLSVRLHLDDCGEPQGAFRVVPRSHNFGRLPIDSIPEFTRGEADVCRVPKGGLLVMRPLLLRASSGSHSGQDCRVIQLDFSARPLPEPLEWYEAHHW